MRVMDPKKKEDEEANHYRRGSIRTRGNTVKIGVARKGAAQRL